MSKRQEGIHTSHQTLDMGDLWSGPSWGKTCGGSCSCSSWGGGGGGGEGLFGGHWWLSL